MIWAVSLLTMELIPHSLTAKHHLKAFGVWLNLVGLRPLIHPVLYLPKTNLTLYLNTFRREPAISGFDWHFTSTHSSSQQFALYTGSVLHQDIILASTWPWVAHPVSGLIQTTKSPYSDSLSLRLQNFYPLTMLFKLTRRLILQ